MLVATLFAALNFAGLVTSRPPTHYRRHHSIRSTNQVFALGVNNPENLQDGVGAGIDQYSTYSGDGSVSAGWPLIEQWVSFEDMFNANKGIMLASCVNLGSDNGPDDSMEEIGQVWNAIQYVSYLSNVDHRFILAVLLQESNGCVRVRTTNNGVPNPGLMQAHDGAFSCNMYGKIMIPCPPAEIFGMVFDGVSGTSSGDGLAGILDQLAEDNNAQVYYRTARQYNSGSIAADGNLNEGGPSTNCYVSDVANRLMGWVWAPKICSL